MCTREIITLCGGPLLVALTCTSAYHQPLARDIPMLATIIILLIIIIVLALMLNHAFIVHRNTMSYVDTLRKEKRILLSYLNWADVPNN